MKGKKNSVSSIEAVTKDQIHQHSLMFQFDANGQWITKTDHIRDIHINDQENLVSNSILWEEKSSGIS